ncbi:major facilitator superfamily domain-containing protein 6-like [Salarias fasciatus]|uniref:Major facilitator superfamily associated domain-containing protein n=1 Tax=Salarias fasciatus TaxID=181472 RepID=A0A672GW83_SALFA|nr:major facilitator superfamily domain-containing protein 6-like [Salarias fasciatus]
MMRRNKQIDIRHALALAGAFTFVVSCAKACLLPFVTLYLRQLGLTPAMTGVVMGTQHFIWLVWSPAASLLSKLYDKRRVVISGSLVASAVVALLLLLPPPVDVNTQRDTCNVSGTTVAPVQNSGGDSRTNSTPETADSKSNGTKSAPVTSGTSSVHAAISHQNSSAAVENHTNSPVRSKRSKVKSKHSAKEEKEKTSFDFLGSLKVMDVQHQLFFLVLIIMSVWALALASLEWTAEDGLYEYLDFADASDRHGSTGVWGLLGAACGVGGSGLLVSQLSCLPSGRSPGSAAHFYCYTALSVLALPVALYLPLHLNRKRDRANGLLKAVQLVRGSPRALLCLVTTLLVGVARSAVDNFLLWQMQDRGASELHMGLALSLALLSQSGFPLLVRHVSRLLSPGRVLAVASATLGLQCFYYSFLWGAWAALPAQVLSCFSGGALWWAVRAQCEDIATPGAERSVSRVYTALSLHLGSGLGSVAGGFAAQRFGLEWLFRGVAVGLTAWCVCLPVLQWKTPLQRRINYSRLLAADASEVSDTESEQEKDWLEKAMDDDRGNNNNNGRRINQ